MSRKKTFDPATFAPSCLTLSQRYISVKDYERAFYQLWEAHEAIFQTPALLAEHSESMGQLLRTISVEAKSVQTNSSDSISFMGMYQRTLIREHLGQHMLLHPAQPLPEIWSHIALSAATALKGQDNWLSRSYAELGYAHPLGVEAHRPALRQLILDTLRDSLISADGRTITNMLFDPLDKLRASGIFRRDPELALAYNQAIEARPPEKLEDRMALKALLVVGMESAAPETKTIRTQLGSLLKAVSPKAAYDVAQIPRIVIDEAIQQRRPLPDANTRVWANRTVAATWKTLCAKDPGQACAQYSDREMNWGLKKPKLG